MDTVALSPVEQVDWLSPAVRSRLEEEILPAYLPARRWFGSKARTPERVEIVDHLSVGGAAGNAHLLLVKVSYGAGADEIYLLPVAAAVDSRSPEIAVLPDGTHLFDALESAEFRSRLLALIAGGVVVPGESGELRGEASATVNANAALGAPSRVLGVEQSNSALVFGREIFVKLFRKPEPGLNPDVEITRHLTEVCGFQHIPAFAGLLKYQPTGGEARVLALALKMVENQGDAWSTTLPRVADYYRRILESGSAENPLADFAARVEQLGLRTAQLHAALAAPSDDPAFTPEPFTSADRDELASALRTSVDELYASLQNGRRSEAAEPLVQQLRAARPKLDAFIEDFAHAEVDALKTRTHGDYHLGQVLDTGNDYVIIDFEGEPRRPLPERRQKRSPLRDVAGMLRSFHYAAYFALQDFPSARAQLESHAETWSAAASERYRETWLNAARDTGVLPSDEATAALLLRAFLIEKAIYEVGYELNNRPDWLPIPLRGLLQVISA